MKLLKSISAEEFTEFKIDAKTSLVSIPDMYELYRKPTIEDQIKVWENEIAEYEAEKEPDEKELIELGKLYHSYYAHQFRKEELIQRLKEYEVKLIAAK